MVGQTERVLALIRHYRQIPSCVTLTYYREQLERTRKLAMAGELPKTIAGWEVMMVEAAEILDKGEEEGTRRAIRIMDKAVGIQRGVRGYKGRTLSTEVGCGCLPLYLVRRVEYESAMRRLNWSEMEIGRMHDLFSNTWYVGDVRNVEIAGEYLLRGTLSGNRFAKRVLDWLAPERARGVGVGGRGGKEEYLRAIREGDRERAVELGRMVDGGQRADATMLMRMSGLEQKALAANNIGFLLSRGGEGIDRDVEEAIKYYEMGIEWGSASAACNLGFLMHYGGEGVRRDGVRAKELYELAIERGERNYAPRNLGILMFRGGNGIRRDVCEAAKWMLLGLREGNESAKGKCAKSLRILCKSWWGRTGVKKECLMELKRLEAERMERLA